MSKSILEFPEGYHETLLAKIDSLQAELDNNSIKQDNLLLNRHCNRLQDKCDQLQDKLMLAEQQLELLRHVISDTLNLDHNYYDWYEKLSEALEITKAEIK